MYNSTWFIEHRYTHERCDFDTHTYTIYVINNVYLDFLYISKLLGLRMLR